MTDEMKKMAQKFLNSAEFDMSSADDDDAYLESVAARMSPGFGDVIPRLEKVKTVYVSSNRDKYLANQLHRLLEHVLSKRNGKRDAGRVLFITGESGAGKTRAIEHLLDNEPALQPQETPIGTIRPVISISLSGPGTLKTLAVDILRAAGYDASHNRQQNELWDLLPAQLRHRKVLLIHIDETQHMLKQTDADRERKNLANALKGLMNAPGWPVSFIMSGLPRTTELASMDEQFERRSKFAYLPDVNFPDDQDMVVKIISQLAEAADLSADEILGNDIPERITHAANNRYGRIATVITAAIHVALSRNAKSLNRDHFIEAYFEHSESLDDPERNVFLIDSWRHLAPGSFLYEKGARG